MEEFDKIQLDPASQFIRPGTPVEKISPKDLPSPTCMIGERNALLLPYY